ncbi:MAG: T9SS type A sorting domain-containing protein [Chitinophagaceae bacterium]
MRKLYPIIVLLFLFVAKSEAQVNFTANDFSAVPPYTGNFLYGSNMGYYPPWTNQTISDIAAGNSALGVKGIGIKSLHLPLPEKDFLDLWGYNVSVNDFIHYNSLGIKDNTVFLEFPSDAHRDNTTYPGCTDQSLIWGNLYTDIWDGGANGTPVNDDNYFALYVYKTVTIYKPWVKFWEVVNEPDYDGGINGWKQPGEPGNWWDNNPAPCELTRLKAPIFNYIRMMRIAYEVIKSVDPTAYVGMGGTGYPAFLDAMLRNTDNPAGGAVTADYPAKGGAYFDCNSFHYYPIYDLRYFEDNMWKFTRHSDAAVDAYILRKNQLNAVLEARGYNGTTYPRKVFINTENQVPRKAFGDYIGSDEAQKNYDIKGAVASQLNSIRQWYLFTIGDSKDYASATSPFDVVGLYQPLAGVQPYNQQPNSSGIGYKTISDLLNGFSADTVQTKSLNLPATVRGGAFKNSIGDYIYVLWAATTIDNSEEASATYAFPAAINMPVQVYQRSWDYSETHTSPLVSSQSIALTGSPSIILSPLVITALIPDSIRNNPAAYFSFSLYPNPVRDRLTIKLHLNQRERVSIKIMDGMGQLITKVTDNTIYNKGDNLINVPLSSRMAGGIYYCRMLAGGNREQTIKFIVAK